MAVYDVELTSICLHGAETGRESRDIASIEQACLY